MSATSGLPGGRSSIGEIDLDHLASGYRHRPAQPASLQHAAIAVAQLEAGQRALDVGGGRGEHAAVWAQRRLKAVVLDPSGKMAEAAARRSGVLAVRGTSQSMPFRPGSFGVVWFHLSIHYGDWGAALGEARRVLAKGGTIEVWTFGPRHHTSSNLSQWFPRVAEIDAARFPEPKGIADELRSLGLDVVVEEHDEWIERDPQSWVAAVRAGFVSTLQLLTPPELEAGLDRFAASHPSGEPLVYPLRFDRIVAADRH